MIIKTTDRFVLRDLELSDRDAYIESINNQDILKYIGSNYPYDSEKFDKMLEARSANPDFHFCLGIEIDGEIVGEVGLNRIERKISNHVATIGYWLSKGYWGQGIMTDAVRFACNFAFDDLKLKKIATEIFPENVGSRRILEKNGFILEGIQKRHAFKDSQYYDIMCYAKFNKN